MSALHSKQIDPELPFEPFPSQVEYSQAEAPYSSRASQVEYNEAEAPFAGQEMESEPVYSQAEAPFVGREVETEPEFTSAEAPFRGREVETEPEFTSAEAPFRGREVETEPEFTSAEAPFRGREVETEPEFTSAEAPFRGREVETEPELTSAEAPFRGREQATEPELSQPRLSNGVNPQAPFAEGKPSNEGNSEKPFEEENESSENESIPWTELRPATPIEEATESIPWTELRPATPIEEPKESIPWTELRPATPIEEATESIPWTELRPATPIEEATESIPWTELRPATPIEKAKESIPWTELTPATPIEKAKESIPWTELTPATPVEETVDPKVFAANQGMENGSLDSLGRPVDGLIINVQDSFDHLAKEDADTKYQKALDAKKVPKDNNGNISQEAIRRRNFYQSGNSAYMIPLSEGFVNEWNQPNNPVFDHALYQNEMLKLVNKLRETEGLNSLTYNPDVQYGADTRAIEIGHKYAHQRPNGESWKTAFDEEDQVKERSENIAYASYTANPYEAVSEKLMAEKLFDMWLNSEKHRKNMLASHVTKMVTSIRVSEAEDSHLPGHSINYFYGVQNFGI